MNIALILSGGTGSRLGAEIPKQYINVAEKPIILYCLERLASNSHIDAMQIVADVVWQKNIEAWIVNCRAVRDKLKGFSNPGENRQMSIFNGLSDIKKYSSASDYVLIHDAARPCISDELINNCFDSLSGHDGVLPVLPMKDTVYLSKNGKTVASLLDREEVYAGQAPELFNLGLYYSANEELLPQKILEINGSTEPAVLANMDIVMIAGDEKNFKITTMSDLERFKKIIEDK